MLKESVFSVVVLVFGWMILREQFSLWTLLVGIVLGIGCIWFYHKYLPARGGSGLNMLRFGVYLFYLVGQIYIAGIFVLKVILTGAKVDIVRVKTQLTNESLRVVLANSITLTPGSILLDLKDDTLTLLWLRAKNDMRDPEVADAVLKENLERQLLKVQK